MWEAEVSQPVPPLEILYQLTFQGSGVKAGNT